MLKIKAMSEEQMDKLLKLTEPLHAFRDKDQHRENPDHPPVWSLILDGTRHTIFTVTLEKAELIDPSALSCALRIVKVCGTDHRACRLPETSNRGAAPVLGCFRESCGKIRPESASRCQNPSSFSAWFCAVRGSLAKFAFLEKGKRTTF